MNLRIILVSFIITFVFRIDAGVIQEGQITGDYVKVRVFASQKSDTVGLLYRNMIVKVLSNSKQSYDIEGKNAHWYKIRYKNTEGWVFGGYLEFDHINRENDPYTPTADMGWFFERFGGSTYTVPSVPPQLRVQSFSLDQYRGLLSIAMEKNNQYNAYKKYASLLLAETALKHYSANPFDQQYVFLYDRLMDPKVLAMVYEPEIAKKIPKEYFKNPDFLKSALENGRDVSSRMDPSVISNQRFKEYLEKLILNKPETILDLPPDISILYITNMRFLTNTLNNGIDVLSLLSPAFWTYEKNRIYKPYFDRLFLKFPILLLSSQNYFHRDYLKYPLYVTNAVLKGINPYLLVQKDYFKEEGNNNLFLRMVKIRPEIMAGITNLMGDETIRKAFFINTNTYPYLPMRFKSDKSYADAFYRSNPTRFSYLPSSYITNIEYLNEFLSSFKTKPSAYFDRNATPTFYHNSESGLFPSILIKNRRWALYSMKKNPMIFSLLATQYGSDMHLAMLAISNDLKFLPLISKKNVESQECKELFPKKWDDVLYGNVSSKGESLKNLSDLLPIWSSLPPFILENRLFIERMKIVLNSDLISFENSSPVGLYGESGYYYRVLTSTNDSYYYYNFPDFYLSRRKDLFFDIMNDVPKMMKYLELYVRDSDGTSMNLSKTKQAYKLMKNRGDRDRFVKSIVPLQIMDMYIDSYEIFEILMDFEGENREDFARKVFFKSLDREQHQAPGFLSKKKMREFVSQNSPESWYGLFSASWLEDKNGNLRTAIDLMERSISLNPAFPESYDNLGILYHSYGDLEEAERNFRKALQLDPKMLFAINNLGVCLTSQEKYDEAKDQLCKAISLSPKYPDPYVNLSTLIGTVPVKDADLNLRHARILLRLYLERIALDFLPDYHALSKSVMLKECYFGFETSANSRYEFIRKNNSELLDYTFREYLEQTVKKELMNSRISLEQYLGLSANSRNDSKNLLSLSLWLYESRDLKKAFLALYRLISFHNAQWPMEWEIMQMVQRKCFPASEKDFEIFN